MIICVVNNAIKIQIISIRTKSFVHANDPDVLNRFSANDTSLVAITPSQAFCSVYDIYIIQRFLLFCYKVIYKYKLVNTLSVDPYAFIQPAKISFTLGGLHGQLWETLLFATTKTAQFTFRAVEMCCQGIGIYRAEPPYLYHKQGLCWEKVWCGIAVNMLDCSLKGSKFELQLCYYIHFGSNTFKERERYEPPISPALGYIAPLLFGLVGGVFANGPGDLGSIPGCVIPKTLKMVLDASLLNT